MAHEMVSVDEPRSDPLCVHREVDPVDGGIRRKTRPVEDEELETVRQGALTAPGGLAVGDAPVDEDDSLHYSMLLDVTNCSIFAVRERIQAVTSSLVCSGRMTPDAASSPHSLATASGLLLGALAAAMLVGGLVGWLFGAAGIGLLVGALVGIPLGVLVVYQVYGRTGDT
jgi:F0F1-type ATP synthase assembly protein I